MRSPGAPAFAPLVGVERTVTNAQSLDFKASQDRPGWTVGAGVEYGIAPNWSVKAEWDFLDFGTPNTRFTDANGGGSSLLPIAGAALCLPAAETN
jgi:opacity protein-like surface antigen